MTTPYAPLMQASEDQVKVDLDPIEARKFVQRVRKVKFFVRTSVDLVTDRDEEKGTFSVYQGMGGNVPMSLKTATKMLESLIRFNNLKAEQGKSVGTVRVTRLGSCVFFG